MKNTNRSWGKEKRSYPALQDFLDELNQNCLLLARHGETDWNAMDILQGQQDRPLSLTGFEQRKNLFFLLNPIAISRIVCSKLQRTIQTALPLSVEKNIQIEKMEAFNEVRLGIFEGLHKIDFQDEFTGKYYQQFLNDEVNITLPGGGESLKMVDKRVRKLTADCIDTVTRTGHVLIVGHRNVNKMIIKNLLGLSLEDGYQVEHKNSWLYIFCPKTSDIFLVKIPVPQTPVKVQAGYEKIEMKPIDETN
jgi:broad specificity phosphatase PhoE